MGQHLTIRQTTRSKSQVSTVSTPTVVFSTLCPLESSGSQESQVFRLIQQEDSSMEHPQHGGADLGLGERLVLSIVVLVPPAAPGTLETLLGTIPGRSSVKRWRFLGPMET